MADIVNTNVTCRKCGYNLTGVAIGGVCPECGTPVLPSFQAAGAPTSSKAIASLVLGIVSIPTCTCYGIPSLICGILAIVFWKQAQTQIAAGGYSEGSRSMAKAGLICGIVGVTLSAALFTIYGVMVLFVFYGSP